MNENEKSYKAFPKAVCLLEALRGMDYTPSSAIADIVDNSISAGAKTVNILFHMGNEEYSHNLVAIADDGSGMIFDELINALRLGVINPCHDRKETDLGRFGLGLKTASFSQCRRFTVYSVKNGSVSCLCWDLDKLSDDNDGWNILEGHIPQLSKLQELGNGMTHGTIVIWENLDRFIPENIKENNFFELIDVVEQYLGLYFHRFLEQSSKRKIQILINGEPIKPSDPFMCNHSATRKYPLQKIGNGSERVEFTGYILPHKDKLNREEITSGSCIDGWVAHEGFFIYRNDRLLLPGGWLGLGKDSKDRKKWNKDEIHQLVRIRLDISNLSDTTWKINIRKSSARPPLGIRKELTKLAENLRTDARKVLVSRGGYSVTNGSQPDLTLLWVVSQSNKSKKIRYRINLEHPIIKYLLEKSGPMVPQICGLLKMIEETVPVQRIWLDSTEGKDNDSLSMPDADKRKQVRNIFKWMTEENDMTLSQICEYLSYTPPFNTWNEIIPEVAQEFMC